MPRKKQTEEELLPVEPSAGRILQKEITIQSAQLKDVFLSYSYKVNAGIQTGHKASITGTDIVHDDLKDAFARLNVHAAVIDDAFPDGMVHDIDQHHDDNIAEKFSVVGFIIDGSGENESVILLARKTCKEGKLSLKLPPIRFDGYYPYLNELRAEMDKVIKEVELYNGGKYAPKLVQQAMFTDEPD